MSHFESAALLGHSAMGEEADHEAVSVAVFLPSSADLYC